MFETTKNQPLPFHQWISTGWQHLLLRSPASIPLRFLPGFYQLRGVPELCTAASEQVEIHLGNVGNAVKHNGEIYEKCLEIVKKIDKWLEYIRYIRMGLWNHFLGEFSCKKWIEACEICWRKFAKRDAILAKTAFWILPRHPTCRTPTWTAEKAMRTSDKLAKGYC